MLFQFGNEDQESVQKNVCLQLMSPRIFQGLPVPGNAAICKDSLNLKSPDVMVMAPSLWSPPSPRFLLDQEVPEGRFLRGVRKVGNEEDAGTGNQNGDVVGLALPTYCFSRHEENNFSPEKNHSVRKTLATEPLTYTCEHTRAYHRNIYQTKNSPD